jgi:SHS2 domain-containing protein
VIPHTADVGIRVTGPDLVATFEEAGLAVAEIAADIGAGAPGALESTGEPVELEAADLPALAFAWLNELIGLADIRGSLVRVDVAAVDPSPDGGWRLRGQATFGDATPRLDIKSATYHGLVVERIGGGWRLTAYLDV